LTLSYAKYAVLIIVLALVQKTFVWLISFSSLNISPDLVIIAVAYIAIKEGKIFGCVTGFLSGLLLDLLSGSFIGLLALSYTIAAFVIGHFQNESDKYLGKYYFLLLVFITSLIGNFVFYSVYFQGTVITFTDIMLKFVLVSSAYTALMSLVYIFFPKKRAIGTA